MPTRITNSRAIVSDLYKWSDINVVVARVRTSYGIRRKPRTELAMNTPNSRDLLLPVLAQCARSDNVRSKQARSKLAASRRCVLQTGNVEGMRGEAGHLMPDRVHVMIPPKYAVLQVMGYIKGKSAIHLARDGERKRNFARQHFLAQGYFVSTVGRGDQGMIGKQAAGVDPARLNEHVALRPRPGSQQNRGRISAHQGSFERPQSLKPTALRGDT